MPSLDARSVASLLGEYAQRSRLARRRIPTGRRTLGPADSLAALAVPLGRFVAEDRVTENPGRRRCYHRHHLQDLQRSLAWAALSATL